MSDHEYELGGLKAEIDNMKQRMSKMEDSVTTITRVVYTGVGLVLAINAVTGFLILLHH